MNTTVPTTPAESEAEHRARVIAGIRALAKLFEDHPDLPIPQNVGGQYSILGDLDDDGRQLVVDAAKDLGVEPEKVGERRAVVRFVVARNAAPEPYFRVDYTVFGSVDSEPETADPTGLNFSREAEDPQPGVVADGIEGGSVTGRASVPEPDSDSAIYATFLAAEKSDNEQLKAWLDRHGITVVGAPAASLRRALADDHAEALDLNLGLASVPDMQTRPQCTCPLGPEDAHFPDCPMFAAEQNGGE